MAKGYEEQILGLIEGGADILLIETITDTLNAKSALWGAWEAFDKTGEHRGGHRLCDGLDAHQRPQVRQRRMRCVEQTELRLVVAGDLVAHRGAGTLE